jgi:hypothetical protein
MPPPGRRHAPFSEPQKQPLAKIITLWPAGHGPIIGLPSTKCVGEMRSGVGRPGSAAALETIEVLPPMIRRTMAIAPSWHDTACSVY